MRDQPAVPAQNGVRLRRRCDFLKRLATEPMTDFPERRPVCIAEVQPPFHLRFADAILCGKIFIAQEKLLVHRPGDVGKHAGPVHHSPPQNARATGAGL